MKYGMDDSTTCLLFVAVLETRTTLTLQLIFFHWWNWWKWVINYHPIFFQSQDHLVDLHLEGVIAALNFKEFCSLYCMWDQHALSLQHDVGGLRDLVIFARVLPWHVGSIFDCYWCNMIDYQRIQYNLKEVLEPIRGANQARCWFWASLATQNQQSNTSTVNQT